MKVRVARLAVGRSDTGDGKGVEVEFRPNPVILRSRRPASCARVKLESFPPFVCRPISQRE